MLNCPNCGAPLSGPKCEYCGTILDPIWYRDLVERLDYLKQQQMATLCHISNAAQSAYLLQNLHRWVMYPS